MKGKAIRSLCGLLTAGMLGAVPGVNAVAAQNVDYENAGDIIIEEPKAIDILGEELVLEMIDEAGLGTSITEVVEKDYAGDCSWFITSDGTMVLKAFGTDPDIIAKWKMKHQKDIKNVILLKGVTYLPEEAFIDFTGITSVTIKDSTFKRIEKNCFLGCSALKSIVLPGSVTDMADSGIAKSRSNSYNKEFKIIGVVGSAAETYAKKNGLVFEKEAEKPVIKNVYVTGSSKSGYTVYCDVTDAIGVSKVAFSTTATKATTDTAKTTTTKKADDDTYYTKVSASDFGGVTGTYKTKITATDMNGNKATYSVSVDLDVASADQKKPVISNVKVNNASSLGYAISCDVTDNTAVERVEFNIWTEKNGQDDLELSTSDEVVVSGNTYTYNVISALHKAESGVYIAEINAFDKAGNKSTTQKYVYLGADGNLNPNTNYLLMIGNSWLSDLDLEGYSVNCKVNRPNYVQKIEMLTYPQKAGKTKGKKVTATQSEVDTWSVRVNLSDFGYKGDTYVTEISVTDVFGNTKTREVYCSSYMYLLNDFTLSDTKVVLATGKTKTLSVVKYDPENTTEDITPTWTSDNTSVAKVSSAGKITAVKEGHARISCTIGHVTKVCDVYVDEAPVVIKYNANGGEGAPDSQSGVTGATQTLSKVKPTKTGYDFIGWNTKADGTGISYAAGAEYKEARNITLYAQWQLKTYAIVYDANGGSSAPKQQTKKYDMDITLSKTLPVRSGYDFIGWNTKADGSGKSYAAGATYKTNGKLTLYAQWKATVSIFSDVALGTWQYEPAKFVYDKQYMVGKGKDKDGKVIFDPNTALTRSEFVTTLYNAEGKPKVTYKNVFKDVTSGQWYSNPIIWAYNNKITSGYGDNFGVSNKITREQMAQMFYSYAKYKGYKSSFSATALDKFKDKNKVSSWATDAMKWAVTNGIMKGKGENLDPLATATRAECAAMLKNFCDAFK